MLIVGRPKPYRRSPGVCSLWLSCSLDAEDVRACRSLRAWMLVHSQRASIQMTCALRQTRAQMFDMHAYTTVCAMPPAAHAHNAWPF